MDYNYRSPGYSNIDLSAAFPNKVLGDKATHPWIYLRRDVPHCWYVDKRNPLMGFLSIDEASVLATFGALIPDADALEIGCHRGWSTAHLAQGVHHLDVIDPALADKVHRADVAKSLAAAGVGARCTLYAGTSPEMVEKLAKKRGKPWSVIFIDGDHEGDASARDAAAVAPHAAHDAIMVFHDLSSPHVADGLAYMRSIGWNTLVFQTMQILGVAWRGNVRPPVHVPDPQVHWEIPNHLRTFRISGESAETYSRRLDRFFVDATSYDLEARRKAQIPRLPKLPSLEENSELQTILAHLREQLSASKQHASDLERDLSRSAQELEQEKTNSLNRALENSILSSRDQKWTDFFQKIISSITYQKYNNITEDDYITSLENHISKEQFDFAIQKNSEWNYYCQELQSKIKELESELLINSKKLSKNDEI